MVGTDVANRPMTALEGLIGFFTNQMPLRLDLSGDPSLRALLHRTRAVMLEAFAHRDLPFDELVRALKPAREAGQAPFFSTKLVLQNMAATPMTLGNLALAVVDVRPHAVPFDLLVNLAETPDGLIGAILYRTALFDGAAIDRLAGHFLEALEQMANDPDRRLGALLDQAGQAAFRENSLGRLRRRGA